MSPGARISASMLRSQRTKRWIITEAKPASNDRRMKGCIWPDFDHSVFNYSSADEVSSPLPSPVPVMPYYNCYWWSERSLDENRRLFVSREIASSERKVVLITALKQGKKRQPNNPELTWRGRARGLSECWQERIQTNQESGQSHGILVLVKAWYIILYLQYIKLYTYNWKLYHEYFYLYHIVSTFFCK